MNKISQRLIILNFIYLLNSIISSNRTIKVYYRYGYICI